MLKKDEKGFYRSTLLSGISRVIHGYSTRQLGDSRQRETQSKILTLLGIEPSTLIQPEQVHGAHIAILTDVSVKIISQADGLVQKANGVQSACIAVHVADCVPILLVDPKAHVSAAVHAGWKGTLAGIATKAVEVMKTLDAKAQDIVVSIGPHIGMCHYDVPKERAEKFMAEFGNDPKVSSFFEEKWHIDIGYANYKQLVDAGIRKEHIDAPPTCTSCQIDQFFSFRKDTRETFGEIMGFIGYTYGN